MNLGTRTSFTLTGWIKPESDFSAIPTPGIPGSAGATPGYDGHHHQRSVPGFCSTKRHSRALQFKVHADPNAGRLSTSNVLAGNDWTFVAVTYDRCVDHVKFYVGNRMLPLP